MSILTNVGNLMYLYLDEIEVIQPIDAPEFLIQATAKLLDTCGGRNWVPVIVREIGKDKYEVIGNSFVYAVAEAAGLERVWCIVADASDITTELSRALTREGIPKINLSIASREEISAALQYAIAQPNSPLKSVKLASAVNRIEKEPRQYWKSLDPISDLKCGITKGKKLDALKQVFYLTPQPFPEVLNDPAMLATLSTAELKKIAKGRKLKGYAKLKKSELIELLSE